MELYCPTGYYNDFANTGKCKLCLDGYYCNFGFMEKCPYGYWCDQ